MQKIKTKWYHYLPIDSTQGGSRSSLIKHHPLKLASSVYCKGLCPQESPRRQVYAPCGCAYDFILSFLYWCYYKYKKAIVVKHLSRFLHYCLKLYNLSLSLPILSLRILTLTLYTLFIFFLRIGLHFLLFCLFYSPFSSFMLCFLLKLLLFILLLLFTIQISFPPAQLFPSVLLFCLPFKPFTDKKTKNNQLSFSVNIHIILIFSCKTKYSYNNYRTG